jgi:hypothetical protein
MLIFTDFLEGNVQLVSKPFIYEVRKVSDFLVRKNFREFPADVVFLVYTHSSLFAGSYFAVSQILGVVPKVKIHYSVPSIARGIKIVRKLEFVFELYRVMLKEFLKKRKEPASPSQCLCKEKKNTKDNKLFFWGGGLISGFLLFAGALNLNLAESEG